MPGDYLAWAERVQSGLALGSVRDGHASGPCVVCDALFGSCVVRDGGRPADGPDECAGCDSRHASRTSPHWGLRERRTCRSGPPRPVRTPPRGGGGWLSPVSAGVRHDGGDGGPSWLPVPGPEAQGRVRRSATSSPLVAQRIAKYNRLLRIEKKLGDPAESAGATTVPCFRPD